MSAVTKLIVDLKGLEVNPEQYMSFALTGLLPEVRKRIHVQGKKASGIQIGTYSNAYLKVRSGNFQNAPRITRGARAGQVRNSGTFTDRTIRLNRQTGVFSGEERVGQPRPNYRRGSDPKVILSLTRQMEQDFSVVVNDNVFGLGFNNEHNYDKAQWNEERYKGVYELSAEEIKMTEAAIEEYINGLLNANS